MTADMLITLPGRLRSFCSRAPGELQSLSSPNACAVADSGDLVSIQRRVGIGVRSRPRIGLVRFRGIWLRGSAQADLKSRCCTRFSAVLAHNDESGEFK